MSRLAIVAVVVAALSLGACSDSSEKDPAPGQTDVAPISGGVVSAVGLGISVTDALNSTLEGPLLVNGFLHAVGDEVRLCAVLLESFPPQCGGDSLVVEGFDPSTVENLKTEGDVSWTDQPIQVLGEVEGGVITVSTTSLG